MIKQLVDSNGDWLVNANTDKALLEDVPVIESKTGVTLPQTFTAIAGPLQALKIYGKVTQASEPTPSSPVPLMCNCGEICEAMFEKIVDGENKLTDEVIAAEYKANIIMLRGDNYLTNNWEQGSVRSADGDMIDSNYRIRCYTFVKPSQQYTIDFETDTNAQYVFVLQYSADGTYLTSTGAWKSLPYTFSTSANCSIVRLVACKNTSASGTAITPSDMIAYSMEEGTTADKTKPIATYVEVPPLFASPGGTKDELNILTGIVTSNIGVAFLDGSEGWQLTSTGVPTKSISGLLKNELVWCTHFGQCDASKTTSQMPNNTVKTSPSNAGSLYFKHPSYLNDLNGWVTWLEQQYAAGTPVTVVFCSSAPIEFAYIDKKHWNTQEGENTITNISQVSGQIADVTYITG